MAERTYAQINAELGQHITALEKLELDRITRREQVTALLRERAEIEERLGLTSLGSRREAVRPRASSSTSNGPGRAVSLPRGEGPKIREWAAKNNVSCPDKGPIPARVRQLYADANNEGQTSVPGT